MLSRGEALVYLAFSERSAQPDGATPGRSYQTFVEKKGKLR